MVKNNSWNLCFARKYFSMGKKILIYGSRLCSTHCSDFLLNNTDPPLTSFGRTTQWYTTTTFGVLQTGLDDLYSSTLDSVRDLKRGVLQAPDLLLASMQGYSTFIYEGLPY
mgnify:CR=1 FL=1